MNVCYLPFPCTISLVTMNLRECSAIISLWMSKNITFFLKKIRFLYTDTIKKISDFCLLVFHVCKGKHHFTVGEEKKLPVYFLSLKPRHISGIFLAKSVIFFFPFFNFFFNFRASPVAYGGSQARGRIEALSASLHHSHRNVGSKPCLWPTPQLKAMPDPQPTEQGQRLNLHPHGWWSDSFPLSHNGNSKSITLSGQVLATASPHQPSRAPASPSDCTQASEGRGVCSGVSYWQRVSLTKLLPGSSEHSSQVDLGFGLLFLPSHCPVLPKLLLSQFSQELPPSLSDYPPSLIKFPHPSPSSRWYLTTAACFQHSCQVSLAGIPPLPVMLPLRNFPSMVYTPCYLAVNPHLLMMYLESSPVLNWDLFSLIAVIPAENLLSLFSHPSGSGFLVSAPQHRTPDSLPQKHRAPGSGFTHPVVSALWIKSSFMCWPWASLAFIMSIEKFFTANDKFAN